MDLPQPPQRPFFIWRAHTPTDAPALHQLELACAPLDGRTEPKSEADYAATLQQATNLAQDSLCAFDESGQLVASAQVRFQTHLSQEFRAFLNGRIHPNYRNQELGSFILSWMAARATQLFTQHRDNRQTCRLRCDFFDRAPDAAALFEQNGFHFSHAEDVMVRDLAIPFPNAPLPANMTLLPWAANHASDFYTTYVDAFRDRLAGKLPWPQTAWVESFTAEGAFRADFSFVLQSGGEGVAFVMCGGDEDDATAMWIDQIGVRSAWRRRGLATALMVHVLTLFRDAGYPKGMLSVNINNVGARRAYEELGFTQLKRYTSYQKILE